MILCFINCVVSCIIQYLTEPCLLVINVIVKRLYTPTGLCVAGWFLEAHGSSEDISVSVCLSVGLSAPCPTPPAADKSLSLLHKASPITGCLPEWQPMRTLLSAPVSWGWTALWLIHNHKLTAGLLQNITAEILSYSMNGRFKKVF